MTASITCPKCGLTSWHPMDVQQRYCGNCHMYHGPHHWRLDGKTPVPCSLLEWAAMFEGERHVARTVVEPGFVVSTVFLGLDHNFRGNGPPLLFETMVFGDYGSADRFDMLRYATWAEAEAGHAETVAAVEALVAAQRTPIDTLKRP